MRMTAERDKTTIRVGELKRTSNLFLTSQPVDKGLNGGSQYAGAGDDMIAAPVVIRKKLNQPARLQIGFNKVAHSYGDTLPIPRAVQH